MNQWDDDEDIFNDVIADFKDYEDYLDHQLEDSEIFYLEDRELARQLIQHNCLGKGDIMSQEKF